MTSQARGRLAPLGALLGAALVWGTLWIPLRFVDEAGITGGYSPVLIFGAATLVLLPVAVRRRRHLARGGVTLWLVGGLTGVSTVLYSDALIYGEVARTVLIFYTLPVWTTLAARIVLRERITPGRIGAVVLGLGGLVVILGYREGIPWPRGWPEWMTLVSSVLFALSIVQMRVASELADFEKVLIQFGTGALSALLLTQLPAIAMHGAPSGPAMLAALPWALLAAFAWILPGMWMNFWGARWLPPGLVGIIMLIEVVFGVVSAALLTSEPFGGREMAGGVLIVGAGALAVLVDDPRLGPALSRLVPWRRNREQVR